MSDINIYCGRRYFDAMLKAEKEMMSIDTEDVPFLALALTEESEIWSDDRHFRQQDLVRIWTTTGLLSL
jgi:predicted nucleic acid-binding protein